MLTKSEAATLQKLRVEEHEATIQAMRSAQGIGYGNPREDRKAWIEASNKLESYINSITLKD